MSRLPMCMSSLFVTSLPVSNRMFVDNYETWSSVRTREAWCGTSVLTASSNMIYSTLSL